MRKRAAALGLLCAAVLSYAPSAGAQTPSVEENLLALINGARSSSLVMHEGLRASARAHAAQMAAEDQINHRAARSRIFASEPVPAEDDGPPDNGFTGTWCEVAGWEPAGADENVARKFFFAWQARSDDSACMMNRAMTAAGVGVYARGRRWWASLALVQDTTRPPRNALSAPVQTAPSPSVAPSPTGSVRALASPGSDSSSSVGGLSRSRGTSSWTEGFGPKEIAVMAGAFMVMPILHTLRRRRAARR